MKKGFLYAAFLPAELYNLHNDPGEENDLAAAEPERVEALKSIMQEAHIPNPDFPVLKGE